MKSYKDNVAVIILAAGLGTRMKSDKAKVLHTLIGKPMIQYVVKTAVGLAGDNVILVVGYQAEKVKREVLKNEKVYFAIQKKQLGTGHAVLCAMPEIPDQVDNIVILYGDVPMLSHQTVEKLVEVHIANERDVSILTVELEDPYGYGRIIEDKNGNVTEIVEEADATDEQKTIKRINTGIYCVKKEFLDTALFEIKSDNAQGEFYLTDIIGIGHRKNKKIGVIVADSSDEVVGINSIEELEQAESVMRDNLGISNISS